MRKAIGEITAPQGVRGEVRVQPFTDHPERFASLRQVWLGEPRNVRVTVEQARPHKGFWLVKLSGVDDRNQAETLRGVRLEVEPEDRAPLKPDEFYVDDLIGLPVITVEGRQLGRLEEVLQTGANDVWVVRGDPARGEVREVLLPALRDVVRQVDLAAGRLVVAPLPGLLD